MRTLKPGTLVRMEGLADDPDPIAVGTVGRVVALNGSGPYLSYIVEWESGRALNLLPEDPYAVIGFDVDPAVLATVVAAMMGYSGEKWESLPAKMQSGLLRSRVAAYAQRLFALGLMDVETLSQKGGELRG